MGSCKIVIDLMGEELFALPAALRRAAVSLYTATSDAALLATLADEFDLAARENPVDVEFVPRGEQGAA